MGARAHFTVSVLSGSWLTREMSLGISGIEDSFWSGPEPVAPMPRRRSFPALGISSLWKAQPSSGQRPARRAQSPSRSLSLSRTHHDLRAVLLMYMFSDNQCLLFMYAASWSGPLALLLCVPLPYTLRRDVAHPRMQHTALSSVADWLAKLMCSGARQNLRHTMLEVCQCWKLLSANDYQTGCVAWSRMLGPISCSSTGVLCSLRESCL